VRLRDLVTSTTSTAAEALRKHGYPGATYSFGVVSTVTEVPEGDEGGPVRRRVLVTGPTDSSGAPLRVIVGGRWPSNNPQTQICTAYDESELIREREAFATKLGLLNDTSAWEEPDCYEDGMEGDGSSWEFAFAQLCLPSFSKYEMGEDFEQQADEVVDAFRASGVAPPAKSERGMTEQLTSDDADSAQNLAMALYTNAWIQRYEGALPHRQLGVTVSNLAAVPGNAFAFTADLEVWLPAKTDRFASSDRTTDLGDCWVFKRPVDGCPTMGAWLMLFNDLLHGRVEEYLDAEVLRPPGTANGMLRLAEKNSWKLEAPTPTGLAVQLKPFQRQSLAWMMAEEAGEGVLSHVWWPFRTLVRPAAAAGADSDDEPASDDALAPGVGDIRTAFFSPVLSAFCFSSMPRVCGGWCAEAMGLGKTIVTLGLIMNDHPAPPPKAGAKAAAGGPPAALTYVPQQLSVSAAKRVARADSLYAARYNKADELIKSKATLVVAPLSLVSQWGDEAARHVLKLPNGNSLRVVSWYGSSRVRDPEKLVAKADVVLTTYDTIASSYRMDENIGDFDKYVEDLNKEYERKVKKAEMLGQPAPKEPQPRQKQRATLHEILWHRVVFDESQYLRDDKCIRTHACQALRSQRRWLLSGTPVSTQPDDLVGQFSVISPLLHRSLVAGCAFSVLFKRPFEFTRAEAAKGLPTPEREVFRGEFPDGSSAMPWLLPRLMIRHASGQVVGGEVVGALPKKTEQVVLVTLDAKERAVYNKVEAEQRRRFGEIEAMGTDVVQKNLFFAMSLLTPLRKLCGGGTFLPERDLVATRTAMNKFKALAAAPQSLLRADIIIDNDPVGSTCACCGLDPEQGVRTKCCAAWCCHGCLADKAQEDGATCPKCTAPLKPADVPSPWATTGFGFSGESGPAQPLALPAAGPVDLDPCGAVQMQSKLRIVLAELAKVRLEDEHAKTLIFSQYSHSLQWLATELVKHNYEHATINGGMSLQQRAAALKAFQHAKPTTIFLLNLRVAAVGLNLTAASHVILLEPCMNPALEEQAIGRVYRMGQTRETMVKRLVVVDSVEQRLHEVVAGKVASGQVALATGNSGAGNEMHMNYSGRRALGTVPTVAGAMNKDKGLVKYDELRTLFGLPPRQGAQPQAQQVMQLAAAADGEMDD
jgi:SWI/SNF-related matrix-associated actin-dependent regulator of chromatin subfamily A3